MTNHDHAPDAGSTNAHRRIRQACLAFLIAAIIAIPMASAGKDGIRRIELTAPYDFQATTRTCTDPCGTGSAEGHPETGDLGIQITMPAGAVSDRRSAQVGSEYALHKTAQSLLIVAMVRLQGEGEVQTPADHLELGLGLAVSGGTCDPSLVLEYNERPARVDGPARFFYDGGGFYGEPKEIILYVLPSQPQYDCLRQPGKFVASAGAYLHAWSDSVNATGQPVGLGLGSTTELWGRVESITVEIYQ